MESGDLPPGIDPTDLCKIVLVVPKIWREKLNYIARRDGISRENLVRIAIYWLFRRRGHTLYGHTVKEADLTVPKKESKTDE